MHCGLACPPQSKAAPHRAPRWGAVFTRLLLPHQMADALPSQLTVLAGSRPGYLTDDGLLVLQRRASTSNLEASILGRAGLTLGPAPESRWKIERSHLNGRDSVEAPDLQTALRLAAEFATRFAGVDVRIAEFVAAYMYGESGVLSLADRIISPLRYEPSTDTVRVAGTNVCVAVFTDGRFSQARVFKDRAGADLWPYIEKALAVGFHTFDAARGDDHCKRRLTWLAGAQYLAEATGPTRCGVLNPDMTR